MLCPEGCPPRWPPSLGTSIPELGTLLEARTSSPPPSIVSPEVLLLSSIAGACEICVLVKSFTYMLILYSVFELSCLICCMLLRLLVLLFELLHFDNVLC